VSVDEPEPALYRELTVVRVRSRDGADEVEAMFSESPQIFRLPRDHPRFEELLEQLQQGERVHVGLASIDSEMIMDVRTPAG
jgi:hypothetical protein